MRTRLIVCPLVKNFSGEYLICKMPADRGAYPGQWGIPGEGVEPGEKIIDALMREVKEEIGSEIELVDITPWTFSDAVRTKLYPDGTSEKIYMVYLIFDCMAVNDKVILNDEFEEYKWVKLEDVSNYDLNDATRKTFDQKRLELKS